MRELLTYLSTRISPVIFLSSKNKVSMMSEMRRSQLLCY